MKKFLIVLVCVVLIFILYMSFPQIPVENSYMITLKRCIDGDTASFLLNGKEVKVRFLGIDTPEISYVDKESEYYGEEAKEYTCRLLKNASSLYLEYDDKSDKYNKYGRVLAWVFVDHENISQLLVKNGYGVVRYIYDDYAYVNELCSLQMYAYQNKLGIWKEREEEYPSNYCNK